MSVQNLTRTAEGLIEATRQHIATTHPRRVVTVAVTTERGAARDCYNGHPTALRDRMAHDHPVAVREDGTVVDPEASLAYEIRLSKHGAEIAPEVVYVPDQARPSTALVGARKGLVVGAPLAGLGGGLAYGYQLTQDGPVFYGPVLFTAAAVVVLVTLIAILVAVRKGPDVLTDLRPGYGVRPREKRVGSPMVGHFDRPATRRFTLAQRPPTYRGHNEVQFYASHALSALADIKANPAWWSDHLYDSRSVLGLDGVDAEAGQIARYMTMIEDLATENGTRPKALTGTAQMMWDRRRRAHDQAVEALRDRAAILTAIADRTEIIRQRTSEAESVVNARADELANSVVAAVTTGGDCEPNGSTADVFALADDMGGSLAEDTAMIDELTRILTETSLRLPG